MTYPADYPSSLLRAARPYTGTDVERLNQAYRATLMAPNATLLPFSFGYFLIREAGSLEGAIALADARGL